MLIRALRGIDGTWYGTVGSSESSERHRLDFFPARDDQASRSPFAGHRLDLDIGETPAPPGWTRFHLETGTYFATDIVCWLLFGADVPDCWPLNQRCRWRCG